jgi:hypothetical protein
MSTTVETHEHRWIDATTMQDAFTTLTCATCGAVEREAK